jgi:hypothetical protein
MKRIYAFLATLIALLCWAGPAAAQDNQPIPPDRLIADQFLQIPGLWDWTLAQLRTLNHSGPFLVIYYEQLCRYCYDHTLLTWVQDSAPPSLKVVLVLHPSHRPQDLKNIRTILSLFFDTFILPDEFREPWDGFCKQNELGRIDALFVLADRQGRVIKASFLFKNPDHIAWLKSLFAEMSGGDSNEK